MDKIMNMAFKTGAYQISMFNSNKRFTMDSQAFLTYQEPSASWVVNSLYESLKRIEGIGFPSEDYAIDFIDRAEKYIVWKNLSKNYDVKNTI